MSAKISVSRRAAFLKALAETGNQTLAAERVEVSRSWVVKHRREHPEFDAAVRQACLDFARHERGRVAVLRDAASTGSAAPQDERGGGARRNNMPAPGWGHLDGIELVVRGTGDGGGLTGPGSGQASAGQASAGQTPRRRVQIARARLKQWDARTEDRFLEVLAATCNVRAGCAAVGLTPASAYKHRERWPGFAARWDRAVTMSSDRIEWALIRAGQNLSSGTDAAADVPIAGMTADHALATLRLHRQQARRGQGARGRPPRAASIEELTAAIEKRLALLDRRRARIRTRQCSVGPSASTLLTGGASMECFALNGSRDD